MIEIKYKNSLTTKQHHNYVVFTHKSALCQNKANARLSTFYRKCPFFSLNNAKTLTRGLGSFPFRCLDVKVFTHDDKHRDKQSLCRVSVVSSVSARLNKSAGSHIVSWQQNLARLVWDLADEFLLSLYRLLTLCISTCFQQKWKCTSRSTSVW